MRRFEAGLRGLPDRQRQHAVLQMLPLHNSSYVRAAEPTHGSLAPTDRFRAAVQDAKIGCDRSEPDIPLIDSRP